MLLSGPSLFLGDTCMNSLFHRWREAMARAGGSPPSWEGLPATAQMAWNEVAEFHHAECAKLAKAVELYTLQQMVLKTKLDETTDQVHAIITGKS